MRSFSEVFCNCLLLIYALHLDSVDELNGATLRHVSFEAQLSFSWQGSVELNAGRSLVELEVTNTGDRPIQARLAKHDETATVCFPCRHCGHDSQDP